MKKLLHDRKTLYLVLGIVKSSGLMHDDYNYKSYFGVRPVVTISRDYF